MDESPFKELDDSEGPDKSGPGYHIAADGHRYHKSATANASTAPTNETTVKNATNQGALNMEELDFVTIVHYHYSLSGELPSLEFLEREYGYETETSQDYLKSKAIVAALSERGVEFNVSFLSSVFPPAPDVEPLNKRKPPPLTPLQLVVANKLLDMSDQKSESKKLKDCGVSTTKFQSWMKDPNFANYLRERAESMLGEFQHEAMLSLIDQVRAGNMKAIQYMHEINGRYVTASARNAGAAAGGNVNVQVLLVRLVEILEDEIDDPDLAGRIGDRIRGLISANAVASSLMEHPTVVAPSLPETAKPREITPEVQEMMNKGLGYQQ